MAGCHSRSTAPIASHGGPFGPDSKVSSGEAPRLNVSPLATPILRRPKSNASTIRGREGSGISAGGTDAGQLHAQQFSRGMPARFERQVEYQFHVHRCAQPGVGADFLLELAAVPACV